MFSVAYGDVTIKPIFRTQTISQNHQFHRRYGMPSVVKAGYPINPNAVPFLS